MMNKKTKWIVWGLLLAFFICYPLLFGIYYTNIFVSFVIAALFAVSVNMLLGFMGLLSFGHAMFFGAGAYGTAIALSHIEGLPLLVSVFIGFMSAILLALLLAPLVVRLSVTAFAMIHMAFGMLMYTLALKLRNITGGEDGIGGFPIPPFRIPGVISIDMTDPINFYYFAMIILGLSIWILWFITRTPFGCLMVGIRDNANRIDYLGFKLPQTKGMAYLIAGGFCGIAGSIFALFQNLISAYELYIMHSFIPIMMIMVGGVTSFFGPILGAGIFALIQELTTRYTERVELVIGLILILVIMWFPLGCIGLYHMLKAKFLSGKAA